MARGWESKAIEAQQDQAQRDRQRSRGAPPSPLQREAGRRRQALELTRTRVLADLRQARVPAHREMLQRALEAIEQQLHALDGTARPD